LGETQEVVFSLRHVHALAVMLDTEAMMMAAFTVVVAVVAVANIVQEIE
jgi:hypothetical protein